MTNILDYFYCKFGYHRFACSVEVRKFVTRNGGNYIRAEFLPHCECCEKKFKWIRNKFKDEFAANHMYKYKRTKLNQIKPN